MKLSDTGSEYCYTFCLLTMLQIWPMANTPLSALTKFEHPSCPSSHFSLPLLSVQLPAVFCSSCFPGWNQVTVIPKPKGINNQLSKWSPKSSLFLNPTLWQRLWRVTKPLLYFFFSSPCQWTQPTLKCGVYSLWASNNTSILTSFYIHVFF